MDLDHEETERRKTTAEFLTSERERYEYLLKCAAAAEHEELAWETIDAKLTVEDFVTAAKEVLAGREAFDKLTKFHDDYDSDRDRFAVGARLFNILYDWNQSAKREP